MFLPLNDKQFEFWKLKRSGILSIDIARLFDISKQAVSRALITMDERIEKTLAFSIYRLENQGAIEIIRKCWRDIDRFTCKPLKKFSD